MSKAVAGGVIACAGARISRECARVIADFGLDTEQNIYHFVMQEWLSEDQLSRAALLWVVDSSTACDRVHPALRYGVPLLVPEENRDLTYLCESARCGIWYANEIDAQTCLEYLLTNDSVRHRLGDNGRDYFAIRVSSRQATARAAKPV